MGIQALKQREMQIEREGNSVLIPKMIKKEKMEFVHSFIPTIKDKVLTDIAKHITPNSFNLLQIKEVSILLQLLLLSIRLREFFVGRIGDAGLF